MSFQTTQVQRAADDGRADSERATTSDAFRGQLHDIYQRKSTQRGSSAVLHFARKPLSATKYYELYRQSRMAF